MHMVCTKPICKYTKYFFINKNINKNFTGGWPLPTASCSLRSRNLVNLVD